jgi:Uma2 family endonuclease
MATQPITSLTDEQYLAIEREAETKSEFYDGQMFAMAGGSPNHSLLSNRVGALLDRSVPAGCRTFNSELRLKVPGIRFYTYADCTVICGDLEYADNQPDVVLNPLLLVEVLSPSTEAYDRGKKFELYRRIPSFREYLLIHQDRRNVEYYSKQESAGGWLLSEYSGKEALLEIARLKVSIGLEELYASAIGLD